MNTHETTPASKATVNERPLTHFKGDRVEYTGRSESLYGGIAYECRIVEGRLKGKPTWTYRPPAPRVGEVRNGLLTIAIIDDSRVVVRK